MQKNVAIWLFISAGMIFLMVIIGGLTRLTDSGLSIVEWQPITGILPPFSEAAWQKLFLLYQSSPEFRFVNSNFTLLDFKEIFYLEYIHRLVGRLAGLIFLLPLIYFVIKKQIKGQLVWQLLGIFLLGFLQGVVGWFMVKSGLKDQPDVSHFWLAFHLGSACLLLILVLLAGFRQLDNSKKYNNSTLPGWCITYSVAIAVMVYAQIIFGALVAGLDAGLIYNSFPDMNGKFLPDDLFVMMPWYVNFFENIAGVQFLHRYFAKLLCLVIIVFWIKVRKVEFLRECRVAVNLMLGVVLLQFSLGVVTLLLQVPVLIAVLHQAVAVLLLAISVFLAYKLSRQNS